MNTADDTHRHDWQDTGRLEKTCDGCQTIASRVRDPAGRWHTEWRATLQEQTRNRLIAAGITPDDQGLREIATHNQRAAASAGIST